MPGHIAFTRLCLRDMGPSERRARQGVFHATGLWLDLDELRVDGKPFGLWALGVPLLISERITREPFMPPLDTSLNCGRSGKRPKFFRAAARKNVDGGIDQTDRSTTLKNQHLVKALKVIVGGGSDGQDGVGRRPFTARGASEDRGLHRAHEATAKGDRSLLGTLAGLASSWERLILPLAVRGGLDAFISHLAGLALKCGTGCEDQAADKPSCRALPDLRALSPAETADCLEYLRGITEDPSEPASSQPAVANRKAFLCNRAAFDMCRRVGQSMLRLASCGKAAGRNQPRKGCAGAAGGRRADLRHTCSTLSRWGTAGEEPPSKNSAERADARSPWLFDAYAPGPCRQGLQGLGLPMESCKPPATMTRKQWANRQSASR
ncbi:hypothetical protein AK812_SmicGene29598 [Symbiodinium microadriaticum]|uniref:Uncharacterized protein n=1 Tax=Symbiodinium microadriaticum TaxID=2951 RepID=A0A1Q9D1F9_SYMMI|nr:hypothetical protein AK812_SmicGene29598 [Symbiodinium microadriaticum]